VKSTLATTRRPLLLSRKALCVVSTPESMTAMPTPVPSSPEVVVPEVGRTASAPVVEETWPSVRSSLLMET
jgi:hypothetical protein